MKMQHSLYLVVLLILSCSSTPKKEWNGPFYSEEHLNFAKWGRTHECCTAKGKTIAVASGGTNASNAGLEVSRLGGNAVDVAVATAFALAVERPHSAGIGGGGFMTLHLAGPKGGDFFIDFRETAPQKAHRDMYLDKMGKIIPDLSVRGGLSVATPSFVIGLYDIHKKWGKLEWKKVLAPSARLAKEGFKVYPSLAAHIIEEQESLKKDAYTKSLLFKENGEPLRVGELLVQKDLSTTIEEIANQGKKTFIDGNLAKKTVTFVKSQNGILEVQDFKKYQTRFREPIRGKFQGLDFLSAPPPSAGGVLMAEMLGVLSGLDLNALKNNPVQYTHVLSEVMKRAYADRAEVIGDPDFFKAPYLELTTKEYTDQVRSKIDLESATPSQKIVGGQFSKKEKKHTTHLSVIDSAGNAVASTLTINDTFGAGLAVPGTGIFLNDEMDDFSAKSGEKNIYGLVSGESNAIAPGKRPVSSMTPTIFLEGGKPVLAVGAAGGSRIITSVMQVSLNYLVQTPGDLKKAMFTPRMHQQWVPDALSLEAGLFEAQGPELSKKGNNVIRPPWSAIAQAVGVDKDGTFTAVFDPRDEGGAAAQ